MEKVWLPVKSNAVSEMHGRKKQLDFYRQRTRRRDMIIAWKDGEKQNHLSSLVEEQSGDGTGKPGLGRLLGLLI